MKRTVTPEWLDSGEGKPEEISASLDDLAMIARRFGGTSTLVALLHRSAARASLQSMTVLDVGAGSGTVAQMAAAKLASLGIEARFTLLDRSSWRSGNGLTYIVGDALSLPFQDATFDVVACSTFAHHLESDELLRFANESLRVARYAAVINDIRRHPIHLGLVYMGFPLFRSRITRHDGPASVRRAYTPEEVQTILARSNAAKVELSLHYLFRMGIVVWKS